MKRIWCAAVAVSAVCWATWLAAVDAGRTGGCALRGVEWSINPGPPGSGDGAQDLLRPGLHQGFVQKTPQAVRPLPAGEQAGPVLGHLETRDRRLTIKGGARYTVSTSNGELLSEDLTAGQLRAVHPELYRLIDPALAGAGVILDATLRN